MDAATGELVRERAGKLCEYCNLPQECSGLRFHIEHIVPRQHGGTDDVSNLALACPACNLRQGPNLTRIDPATRQVTPLFHPRHDPPQPNRPSQIFTWNQCGEEVFPIYGRRDLCVPSRVTILASGGG